MSKNYITVSLLCALSVVELTNQVSPKSSFDLYADNHQLQKYSVQSSEMFSHSLKFQYNGENSISVNCNYGENDKDVLEQFVNEIIENSKLLEPEFSKIIDDNFWDLV